MPKPTLDDELVTITVPRAALTVTAPPPSHVHQATVAAVVGLDRKTYLRLSRRGAWPVVIEGRKYLARTADVQAYLDDQAKKLAPRKKPAANEHQDDAEFAELPAPKGFRHAS